jgi:hypothetical protein
MLLHLLAPDDDIASVLIRLLHLSFLLSSQSFRLGKNFAYEEMNIVLAYIISKLNFAQPPNPPPIEPRMNAFLLSMKNDFDLSFSTR